MKEIALLYHDVVGAGNFDSSGFPGADAGIYKLADETFRNHLDAIANVNPGAVLTFDDGGVSAYSHIAGALEQRGWRGHFFVATNWIGQPGFLNEAQIRELHVRGHIIGTHSCSHPSRISRYTLGDIIHEWSRSATILRDIVGAPVVSGSVPGGFYSIKVARAAAIAGLTTLFTSEPTLQADVVEGCTVKGRFMVQRYTSVKTVAALARGDAAPRLRQSLTWNTKKVLKAAGGNAWLEFRRRVFAYSRSI